MRLTVIGAGLGHADLLSVHALEKIKAADLLIATDRLFDRFHSLNPNSVSLPLSAIVETVRRSEFADIVVLASGDVGFYSISATLRERLPTCEMEFVSGVSSLQYLTAKLQISYEGIKTVSVHGREQSAVPFVCYQEQVFVLTGGKHKAQDVIADLVACGLGDVMVTVGENLSDETERILTDRADAMTKFVFGDLAVLLVENKRFVNPHAVLRDSDFVRANVPMTKAAVRDISLASLDIQPTDVVYDIGAGTGSVAIAMARKACDSFVYAIEKENDAVALIEENKKRLGSFNLKTIAAKAPEGLAALPSPDKVFIGGSSGNLAAIFEVILSKNPQAKITVNAITLETLQEATSCFEQHKLPTEIVCVNLSRAEKLGRYQMMKAQNPVYILSGGRL